MRRRLNKEIKEIKEIKSKGGESMLTRDNLPEEVKALPKDAQDLWFSVYEKAFAEYGEEDAQVLAWMAVLREYYRENGKWVKIGKSEDKEQGGNSATDYEEQAIDSNEPLSVLMENRVWSTKYVNDLPDEAFAVILPGGEKDEEGKTKPRSLRYFPHHNKNVKDPDDNDTVDLPHLRNALARLPQAKIPEEYREKARRHLIKHAKALGVGRYAENTGNAESTGNTESVGRVEQKASKTKKIERDLVFSVLLRDSEAFLSSSEDDVLQELTKNNRVRVISTISGVGRIANVAYRGKKYRPYIPKEFILENYQKFDNVKTFIGHTSKYELENGGRDITRWVGTLTDPEVMELGDGRVAVVNWLNLHDTETIQRMKVKTFRDNIGLSHEMVTDIVLDSVNGEEVVRVIGVKEIRSVDLVAQPNFDCGVLRSSRGYHEEVDYELITLDELRRRRPDIIEALEVEIRSNVGDEVSKAKDEVAKGLIEVALGDADLPDAAKDRIRQEFSGQQFGSLDELKGRLSQRIAVEKEYIARVAREYVQADKGKPRHITGVMEPAVDGDLDKIREEMSKKFNKTKKQ
ncbi:MAG: ChaB family protein [candidate division WOR-3 bacterium]